MGSKESMNTESCLNGQEVDELSLDPNVLIRYHRALVPTGQPLVVSVNLRGDLSAELAVVRSTNDSRKASEPWGILHL